MPESIIAASLSRIESKVLHLDCFDFYGGCWGSFNLRSFRKLLHSELDNQTKWSDVDLKKIKLEDGEKFVEIFKPPEIISNVKEYPKISDMEIKEEFPYFNWTKIGNNSTEGSEMEIVDLNKPVKSDEETLPEEHDSQETTAGNEDQIVEMTRESTGKPTVESSGDDHCVKQDEVNKAADATVAPSKKLSIDDVVSLDRKFHIDLVSKLLYNKGSMVELLISSDVARYCEFKIVSRILTLLDGSFQTVPCSKSDVFTSTAVSIFEKRLLMKFLTMALTYNEKPEEYQGFESKKFTEFLDHKKLTRTLKHFVQHALAMVSDDAKTLEGLAATQKYLLSLGRYGNSSFLFPLFGVGELIQCFCRLSAVFGGVYCLSRHLKAIILDSNDNLVSVVDSSCERLNTKWLVVDPMYIKSNFLPSNCQKRIISRAILITNKSVLADEDNHITLCNVSGELNKNILMQELSSVSQTCPDNFYIVHLTCDGSVDAETDLKAFVEKHFNCSDAQDGVAETESCSADDRPHVLWCIYFNIESLHVDAPACIFNKVLITSNPDTCLDCDKPIQEAEKAFRKMYPDQAFLPKAPRPEEIIFCDEASNKTSSEHNVSEKSQLDDGNESIKKANDQVTEETKHDDDADTKESS